MEAVPRRGPGWAAGRLPATQGHQRRVRTVHRAEEETQGSPDRLRREDSLCCALLLTEEDLGSASFAGGYETVLGVTADRLEAGVHTVFATCLDARIVTYKHERGLAAAEPRIAIVVQEQIASEAAGVGFSVYPVSSAPEPAVC